MGRALLWAGGFFRGEGKRITSCFHTLLALHTPYPITFPRWLREGLAPRLLGGRSSSSVSSKEGKFKRGKVGEGRGQPKKLWGEFWPKAALPKLRRGDLGGETSGGGRVGGRKWGGRFGDGSWADGHVSGPPYTLPSPPPRSKLFPLLPARVPEKEGGARHWRHLLSRAKRGRAVPQRKKALGAHGPEPRA